MNIPSRISTRNIAPRITIGATSNPVAQPTNPRLAPEKDSSWLNTVEFIRMKNTMPTTRIVPISDVLNDSHVSARRTIARIRTPTTPNDADSDGVAQPSTMKPMTRKITKPIGRIFTRTW